LVRSPGPANTSRFCSSAQHAVMRVSEYSPASNTSTPTDIPPIMRLPMGKFCGAKTFPAETRRSARRLEPEFVRTSANFSLGQITSTPVPKTAMVLPLAEIAPRWLAVSTPRAMPLMMTSPCPARSRPTVRPCRNQKAWDDVCPPGDAGHGQDFRIAAHPQDGRRIINFFRALGVRGIVQRNPGHVGSRGGAISSRARRFSRGQGLGGNGLNAGAFEFG